MFRDGQTDTPVYQGMSGTKQAMLKFEERLASLSVPEKEKAIAKYIDLNRKALDGLDLKMILVRSVANYCDTFQYMLDFVNDKRKMVFYYQRIKAKYIQYHEVFEQDGKFGMKDHQGNVLLAPVYDFLRTCYIYNDDLSIMPVIAEKNGKMGLVMPDGKDTIVQISFMMRFASEMSILISRHREMVSVA